MKHLIMMGVAGCGKTTVGAALSERVNRPFFDGDDFHPRSNIEKMSAGTPLTDEDRMPWLSALVEVMKANPGGAIVSCSALKKIYRDFLRQQPVHFIFLDIAEESVMDRIRLREHFFPLSLIKDQFLNLEVPDESEATRVDGCLAVDVICDQLAPIVV